MTPHPSILTIEAISAALRQPLPGPDGQRKMAPSHRPDPEFYALGARDCRRAAILLLLYPHNDELYTVLIVRPHDLPDHPGQVAFPGGARNGKETVLQTALREAQEELGIDPAGVTPRGRLTHIYIPPSRFCIQIVVGYTPRRPLWRPAAYEVAEVIEAPIAHFLDPANQGSEERLIEGQIRLIPYYRLGEHKVWGATAMVIAEFTTLLSSQAIVCP